ncbi:hypothetical protein ACP70R_007678 [Stipagrostis hirtigluma subsp. patula]
MSFLSRSAVGGGAGSGSTSTVTTVTAAGWHVLKVEGYSKTKGLTACKGIESSTFVVGGHS